MNRLRKISSHDYISRMKAVVYINGELIEGEQHARIIHDYYVEKKGEGLENYYYRPNQDVLDQEDSIAFLHIACDERVNDEKNGLTSEKAMFIETNSLSNVTIDEVVSAVKQQYPDLKIYNDDSFEEMRMDSKPRALYYEKLAFKRLIKK